MIDRKSIIGYRKKGVDFVHLSARLFVGDSTNYQSHMRDKLGSIYYPHAQPKETQVELDVHHGFLSFWFRSGLVLP